MQQTPLNIRSLHNVNSLIRVFIITVPLFFSYITSLHAAPPTPAELIKSEMHSAGQLSDKLDPKRLIHKDINKDLDVPPVFQRPLGVDAGGRIHVSRFEVKGVVEHPDFGINQKVVDDFVEGLRIDIQNLNTMNEFGLSDEDMKAIGKQLQETLYEDDEIALIEHAKLLKKLRQAKRYREEMSIGQLQEVANKLTDFYRKNGLVIAQVFVPEQTIEDGVVTLHVLEGILGATIIENNKYYSTSLLKSPFKDLEHKFVSKDRLESALLVLSDFPGLLAYGVLQPGVEQGETDLLIKVQEEVKHEYTVKLDNYGTESTGDIRFIATYRQNNALGNGDLLSANIVQSFSPTNSIFGGFNYVSPIRFSNYNYNVGFSTNSFDVGDATVTGTVTSFHFGSSKVIERSRRNNSSVNLDFENKTAETFSAGNLFSEDGITSLGFTYTFDNLDIVNQAINQGSVKLTQAFPGLLGSLEGAVGEQPSRPNAISDFTKLTWNIARLQLISKDQNLLIKTEGQYTGDLVPPVEQFGMGGPTNVRAFATSQFLADSAIYAAIDWNFNAPGFFDKPAFDTWKWGEILQFSVFADYAYGTINEASGADISPLAIGGVGLAAQMVIPGKMTIRFDVSTPVVNDSMDPDETQFYLTFSYSG